MVIDVTGIRWRATTIRIDRIGGLSGLSQGDWNQRCDYLMVIDKGGTYCAAFIELKNPAHPVWTKSHNGILVSAFLGPTVPLAALIGT